MYAYRYVPTRLRVHLRVSPPESRPSLSLSLPLSFSLFPKFPGTRNERDVLPSGYLLHGVNYPNCTYPSTTYSFPDDDERTDGRTNETRRPAAQDPERRNGLAWFWVVSPCYVPREERRWGGWFLVFGINSI